VTPEQIVRRLIEKQMMLATAESCTGGLVAAAITDVAGSSAAFDRGFVTYSNDAKVAMLGVPSELLEQHGAVSEAVARSMAEGALENSEAHIAVSITGIAGPTGGSEEKPIGLVHFACAIASRTIHLEKRYGELGRDGIRKAAVATALQLIWDCL
jgi:nicotinamide-nucleotide amidase